MSDILHISSLIVHFKPNEQDQILARLSEIDGLDIHGQHPSGKIVITLETANEGEILETIQKINDFTGVLNTNLVFHQVDQPDVSRDEGIA